MVTNAVNMDLKVNAAGGAKRQDTDGGFSDVLGSVSSDNDRRQPGLSNSGKKEFGKEFGFTQRASETVHSKSSDTAKSGVDTAAPAEVRKQFDASDEPAADKLLSQAAETVTRAVAESGEAPTKEEAAEMMSDALKGMAAAEKPRPEEAVKTPVTEETPDELLNALVDVISAMADGTETVGTEAADTEEPVTDSPAIRVITPDASFMMTEKHVEAAMITEGTELAETPDLPEMSDEDNSAAFEDELNALIDFGSQVLSPQEDEFGLRFMENAREMFTGRTEFANDDFTDRSGLIEKVLAKLDSEAVEEGGEPVTEMAAVRDTAKLLSEMIDEAKKKLGLTEVKYEHTNGEQDAAAPLIQDESAKLSRSMNRSDRTVELDHILGNGREDAPKQEDGAPKTETYDAVHMSAHLMSGRTDTDIPVERTPMPEENTAQIRPPEIQTAEQILERINSMQDDHAEFTMVLNPESLGRITVKLVMAGERTAVEITAENPETRAILAARSENLQSMLRENGVELERYQVVSEQEDAQFEQQSYDGSSKNPYSRDDGEQENQPEDGEGESFYDILGNI